MPGSLRGSCSPGLLRALSSDSLDQQHIGLKIPGKVHKHLLAHEVKAILWLQKQDQGESLPRSPMHTCTVLISGQLGSSEVSWATHPPQEASVHQVTYSSRLLSSRQPKLCLPPPTPQIYSSLLLGSELPSQTPFTELFTVGCGC